MEPTNTAAGPALKATVLHDAHLAAGAKLVDFGGWDMPLWYPAGAVREHLAVITAAGLFDTSHMDLVLVAGFGARAFLDYAFTRDIAALPPGRAAYGAFLDARGHCLDDGLVYPFDDDRFGLVVNASMGGTIVRHLSSLPGGVGLSFDNRSGRFAKLDLQGPEAPRLLAPLLENADAALARLPYFSFRGDFDFPRSALRLRDGTPLLLSRTGYTGEVGFEIFLPAGAAPGLWRQLLDGGALACGLAARDSLRAGAGLPLSHQDIGDWPFVNHPWPFALPVGEAGAFTKEFHGAAALDPARTPHTLPFVGHDPRKVDTHGSRVIHEGQNIGTVLTAVADMAIGRLDGRVESLGDAERRAARPAGWTPRGLVCGFVKVDRPLPRGTAVEIKDARRSLPVEIVGDIRPGRTARMPLKHFLGAPNQ